MFPWCSWSSRQPNMLKVSSSNLDGNMNMSRPRPNQPSKEETPVLGGSDFPGPLKILSQAEQGILLCFCNFELFRLRKQMASNKKAIAFVFMKTIHSLLPSFIFTLPPPQPSPLVDELVTRFSRALPPRSRSLALTHALTHSLALAHAPPSQKHARSEW